MTVSTYVDALGEVIERAGWIAVFRKRAEISTTHLLLAVMADRDSKWPCLINERGGLTYGLARKRVGALPELGDRSRVGPRYGVSVRLALIATAADLGRRAFSALPIHLQVVRDEPGNPQTLLLAPAAETALRLARGLNESAGVGHLLIVLASIPGAHLRLLDTPAVIAAAARREVGMADWHHELLIAADWPRYQWRRLRAFLKAGIARRGHFSLHSLGYMAFRGWGGFWAITVVFLFILPTVVLYLFLWPAVLLVNGLRSLFALLARSRVRTRRWYEIPGGESEITHYPDDLSGRRLAAIIIFPRLVAFGVAVAMMYAVIARLQKLGVVPFPILYRRPDLLLRTTSPFQADTAAAIVGDAFTGRDFVSGVAFLAGLGAAVLSMPTYRELQLVRLASGHDFGRGSRILRIVTAPAALLAGVLAVVETILGLRSGPFYLTVYVVPLFLSFVTAGLILSLTYG